MNWKYFFIGIGFLVTAYLIYQGIKKGPASEKTNGNGPILPLYIQGWGSIFVCAICGVTFIIKSLPS
jgi:hypothetical protein